MTTDWTTATKGSGEYADVNGINLYYETRGSGRPMILLHGGLGSGEMFGPILPMLAEHRQVIAVDLQGHGRTADIDRPIDIRLMADDIAALIDHLGLDTPDLVGYSLGGGVAFFMAVKYPDKVGRLVMAATNIRRDAIPAEMLAQQGQVNMAAAEFMMDTPMYQLYQKVAPRPEDFGRLLDKIGEAMAKDFDFSEEVRSLTVPTLIVAADADMAPPSHYIEIFKLLDGGLRDGGWMGEGRPKGGHALAILPGLTHYNLGASPLFAAVTLDFIDGQRGRGGGEWLTTRGIDRAIGGQMNYRIEAITLPVTDIDRAKAFYEQAGWNLDVDTEPAPGMRVVQLTPPGSDCSITFGIGMDQSEPGSYRATYLVVTDIEPAHAELKQRGIPVSDIYHYGPEGQAPGVDPAHGDYFSYASFADPDGNTWLLQEVPSRT